LPPGGLEPKCYAGSVFTCHPDALRAEEPSNCRGQAMVLPRTFGFAELRSGTAGGLALRSYSRLLSTAGHLLCRTARLLSRGGPGEPPRKDIQGLVAGRRVCRKTGWPNGGSP